MKNLYVDNKKIEFKCSNGNAKAKAYFKKDILDRLECVCCDVPTVVQGNHARRMLAEEIKFLLDNEKKDNIFRSMESSGVQITGHTFPEFTRPEWEFFVIKNDYITQLLTSK